MSLLRDVLHWLPDPLSIEYKLCLSISAWSSSRIFMRLLHWDSFLHIQAITPITCEDRMRRMRTHFGYRAFLAAGPQCRSSLPPDIRLADSVDSFKAQLKTYLFAKAYPTCYLFVRRPCSGNTVIGPHYGVI